MLQFASLSFDAALWEIASALSAGAALVLTTSDARSGAALAGLMRAQGVSALGYTIEEIAELTDAPVGTVKDRLVVARRELRSMLEREARRNRSGTP